MNKKQQKREKNAWLVALLGSFISIASLILLFTVILSYNETLLVISYNAAYLAVLLGLGALGLTMFAIGMDQAQKDGGLGLLQYRSGKLAVGIIVAALLVIALARVEVYQHEIVTGVRSPDGAIQNVE